MGDNQTKSSRRKLVLRGAFAVVVILIVVLAIFIWRSTASPVSGRIIHSTPDPRTTAVQGDKTLEGKFLRLQYAYYYMEDSRAQPADPQAEQHILHAPGRTGKQLALAVEALPTSTLTDNGSYKMRRSAPDIYKESTRTITGQSIAIMTKLDGAEVVAFWPHGQQIATIALVSGMGDDLSAELDRMLATFSWK